MKKLILFMLLMLSIQAKAQLQYDYFGGYSINANANPACFFFNVHGDFNNDLKFVFGNGQIYFEGVQPGEVKVPVRESRLWNDCKYVDTSDIVNDRAYVIDGTTNIGLGDHVLPFKHLNYYGYFVLRVFETTINIRGYLSSQDELICFDDSTLDLDKIPEYNSLSFSDYDLNGIPVPDNYSGIIVRRYGDGSVSKLYK